MQSQPSFSERDLDAQSTNDGVTAVGLVTLCALGAGLASWLWHSDSKQGDGSNQHWRPSSPVKRAVEYRHGFSSDGIKKSKACMVRTLSPVNELSISVVEESCCSITPETPQTYDFVRQEVITVPASPCRGDYNNSKYRSLSKTKLSGNEKCHNIGQSGNLLESYREIRSNRDRLDYVEFEKPTADSIGSFEEDIISIDNEVKLVTQSLKKLRSQSIDFLLTPGKSSRTSKCWKEIEEEIKKREKAKVALQNQRDEILTDYMKSLMDSSTSPIRTARSTREISFLENSVSSNEELDQGELKLNSFQNEYFALSNCESYVSLDKCKSDNATILIQEETSSFSENSESFVDELGGHRETPISNGQSLKKIISLDVENI